MKLVRYDLQVFVFFGALTYFLKLLGANRCKIENMPLINRFFEWYLQTDGEIWTIRGVHLPNGEDYASRDDVRLSVAFGFVAHLCELIAFVVNVPLRHPVEFKGSRSSVISHLAPGMAGVGPITVTDQPLVQIPLSFHFALTFFLSKFSMDLFASY